MSSPITTVSTMDELLPTVAGRFADNVALIDCDTGRSWSFAELNAEAVRLSRGFRAAGLGRGDHVLLFCANSHRWVAAYHAVARLGAVLVPANILLSPGEIEFIIGDCDPKLLLFDDVTADKVAQITDCTVRAIDLSELDGDSGADGEEEADAGAHPAPSDPFTLCYTSGTTGKSKGVIQSHANLVASALLTQAAHERTDRDRILTALPLPHVYGCAVMNSALLSGATVLMMRRFQPDRALDLIAVHRATVFEGVPTMYYQLLAQPGLPDADLSSLRLCTVGGQTMPKAKLDQLAMRFQTRICELWGMTELSGPAVTHSPSWPPRHGTIGLPMGDMEARVVHQETRLPVAAYTAGELQVRGILVTPGYWRNAEATAQAIDPDGWLSTGDVCVADEDGYLRIVDRCKDMIISGGYNIYPAEVEQVIAGHSAVEMVAIGADADEEKGEALHAYIVLVKGAALSVPELDSFCRRHLAAYKVPKKVSFVEALPMTSTGKIMRQKLRH